MTLKITIWTRWRRQLSKHVRLLIWITIIAKTVLTSRCISVTTIHSKRRNSSTILAVVWRDPRSIEKTQKQQTRTMQISKLGTSWLRLISARKILMKFNRKSSYKWNISSTWRNMGRFKTKLRSRCTLSRIQTEAKRRDSRISISNKLMILRTILKNSIRIKKILSICMIKDRIQIWLEWTILIPNRSLTSKVPAWSSPNSSEKLLNRGNTPILVSRGPSSTLTAAPKESKIRIRNSFQVSISTINPKWTSIAFWLWALVIFILNQDGAKLESSNLTYRLKARKLTLTIWEEDLRILTLQEANKM